MIISLLKALDEYTCYRLGSWTSRECRESAVTSAVKVQVQWKCSDKNVVAVGHNIFDIQETIICGHRPQQVVQQVEL